MRNQINPRAGERIRVAVLSDVTPSNEQQQFIEAMIVLLAATLLATLSLSVG